MKTRAWGVGPFPDKCIMSKPEEHVPGLRSSNGGTKTKVRSMKSR